MSTTHTPITLRRAACTLALASVLFPASALAGQDLRSPDARDAADGRYLGQYQDLRSPDARDAARGVTVVSSAPAAQPSSGAGVDWPSAGIGAAGFGALVLIGAAGAVTVRRRVA
jgi:hypothetical protein